MLVVFSLMHKAQRKSDNARMATGWSMILWSICSILDAALASDIQGFDMALLQKAGGLLGYVLGCPLAWGLSKAARHRYFRGRHSVFAVDDHPYAG